MNKYVVVVGAGGHAKVVVDTLRLLGDRVVALLDSNQDLRGSFLMGHRIIGGDEMLDDITSAGVLTSVGVSSIAIRRKLFEMTRAKGFRNLSLIHPTAILSRTAELSEGCQVMARAVVQTGSRVGLNAIVNTGAVVDHDTVVCDHAHIGPGAVLAHRVSIGAGTLIGAGATVLPDVRVGDDCRVGAGATVVADVANGTTVVGNPAVAVEGQ
ncbi:acetyltransferase [Magnetospira sp. QH-2]|uniref:acetyltransferase n=1 Tax=Magnetospira sp. (strain QH-2) TaxID=1288970 RepID=UPI0003E81A2D|nr:acetyltransferase [Magnetospira sp. QH-2]CCQ75366.1 putative Acetyltransferase [Magnetospira sp. QH-2]